MASFVIDLLSVYFSSNLWGVFLLLGFCSLCFAALIDFLWSFLEV